MAVLSLHFTVMVPCLLSLIIIKLPGFVGKLRLALQHTSPKWPEFSPANQILTLYSSRSDTHVFTG